jgi:hypothetical protein
MYSHRKVCGRGQDSMWSTHTASAPLVRTWRSYTANAVQLWPLFILGYRAACKPIEGCPKLPSRTDACATSAEILLRKRYAMRNRNRCCLRAGMWTSPQPSPRSGDSHHEIWAQSNAAASRAHSRSRLSTFDQVRLIVQSGREVP